MKYLSWIPLALLVFTSCQLRVHDAGEVATVSRTIENYSAVEVSGAIDLVILNNNDFSIQVEGPSERLAFVTTDVNDGVLIIKEENNTFERNQKIEVTISNGALERIITKGSGDVSGNVEGEEIWIESRGSGDVGLDLTGWADIYVESNGSGDVALFGAMEGQYLYGDITGSGDLNAGKIVVTDAVLTVVGSGDVAVHALGKIDATLLGSGDLEYCGDAELNVDIKGSGSTSKRCY